MFELTGKKALVTGASGGIGEAIARILHAQGAIVGLHGTRVEKLEALAADLGDRVKLFPADLTSRAEVKVLGQKAEADLEGVDILVNNAGITKDGLFVRMSDADWDAVIEVNLTAVFRLTRELTHPMMRRRNGRIINITSVVGVTGNPGQANYCASKAGMIGFTKSLAQEIATRNVTVNCVAPGFIELAMTGKLNDKQKEAIMNAIPSKRMGTGNEVAAAVAFLASHRGGLRHWPDHSREWRHGDDLTWRFAGTGWFDNAIFWGFSPWMPPDFRVMRQSQARLKRISGSRRTAFRQIRSFNLISGKAPANEGTQTETKEANMSDTAERVKKIVVEHLGVEADKVTEAASFIDDLGADSLDTVELVMAFEEEFGVEIPDDAAETILTVGDAVKYIDKASA